MNQLPFPEDFKQLWELIEAKDKLWSNLLNEIDEGSKIDLVEYF